MKPQSFLPAFSLLTFLLFVCQTVVAQQNASVQLTGVKMRAPLTVAAGKSGIDLCGLTPGNTYTVSAANAVREQNATFEFASTSPAQQIIHPRGRLNIVRFVAQAECFTLSLKTDAGQQADALVPMSLSVKCNDCPGADAWKQNLIKSLSSAAVLEVQGGQSAEDLIKNTLIDGDCYDVENVTYSGLPEQIGTFSNGATNIGVESGIIIATGNIDIAPGPNDSDQAYTDLGVSSSDDDLSQLAQSDNLFDLAVIEFDFKPTESITLFDFVFASEEYCEYVDTIFNDVFGFFLSGPGIVGKKNLAVVPGTNDPVSINTINHLDNPAYYVNNTPSTSGFLCGQAPATSPAVNELQYDGFTQNLIAIADSLDPCMTYHIELKIADVGDGAWDSGVFLKGGSFNAGDGVAVDFLLNGNSSNEAYEACGTVELVFNRVGGNLDVPATASFSIGGTATNGVDYSMLNTSYTIPAGQDVLVVPVTIFSDALAEGVETIILTLDDPCSCDDPQVILFITDYEAMTVPGDSTILNCFYQDMGGSHALTASPQGGVPPYTYEWSTGAFTSSIVVSPIVTTSYTVTVTDACDATAEGFFLVTAVPVPETIDTIRFCPGGSVVIGNETYTEPGIVTTSFGGDTCDGVAIHILEWLPLNELVDTIGLCPGATVNIGGVDYTAPNVVVDTLPGMNGECDTIATYILELLPLNETTDTIGLCPGVTINIGGTDYTAPNVVVDLLEGINGECDTIAVYVLELRPLNTFTATFALCPGVTINIGGMDYPAPNVVVDTLPGMGGDCDTIATYVLELLPQVSFTDTIFFCPGEVIVINGMPYTQEGTVLDTLTGMNGECDTLATYVLVSLTPAPSNVSITCPADFTINVEPAVGTYATPTASTDCVCPGISLELTEGLPSGSTFPMGVTKVCYEATDSCGNTASCCFNVSVPIEEPCEEATIGCIKYELIDITEDDTGDNTYRIRVHNNCTNNLMYVAFGLPSGVVAVDPPTNSVYTAPSGRNYIVRNPNFSPFYSIRFKADGTGMGTGQSDRFQFTLPAQSEPANIQVIVRIAPKVFYSAYLHTYHCPVQTVSKPTKKLAESALDRDVENDDDNQSYLSVYPNPTDGSLFADLSDWQGQQVQMQIVDSRGQRVQQLSLTADAAPQEILLPKDLANGLYVLEILTEQGEKQVVRFVVQR